MGTAASWNGSLYSEGWLPAALISQPEVRWVVGSQGHTLELPKEGVFPWPTDDRLASTWLQFIFESCRVWSALVMVCQHQPQLLGTLLPPLQNGTVQASATLPSIGLVCVPSQLCLPRLGTTSATWPPGKDCKGHTEPTPSPSTLPKGHILWGAWANSLLSLVCSASCVAFCSSSLAVEDKGGVCVVYQQLNQI